MHFRYYVLVLISSLVLSFLLYGNTLTGEFVWDDHFFAGRPQLRNPGYLLNLWVEPLDIDVDKPSSYRPMLTFTSALNFLVTGDSPLYFHAVNIILNGVVIFLVYLLVYKLFSSKLLALFSALLFAFFPIHTEAVAQIKSRDELLAALFILISHIVFIKATESTTSKINYRLVFLSSILFLAAVFAKEFMIVVPAIFLLIYWVRKNPSLGIIFRIGLLFVPVTLFYFLMRFLALGEQTFGPADIAFIKNPLFYTDWWLRIGTGFKAIFIYFFKTFVPQNLSATYAYNHFPLVANPLRSWETMGGIFLIALLLFSLYKSSLRKTPLAIGLLIFFIPIFLASNLTILVTDLFAERWVYYPSIGLAIIAGYTLTLVYNRSRYITLVSLLIVLGIYAVVTLQRNVVWTSNDAFYKHIVIDAPNSVHGRYMLANYFQGRGDFEAARPHIEHGLAIYRHPHLVELAAIGAFHDGDYPLAKKLSAEVLEELKPTKPQRAHLVYAIVLSHEGQYQKSLDLMMRLLEKGEKLDKIKVAGSLSEVAFQEDNPVIRFILAVNLYKLGRVEEARKYFDWEPHLSEKEKIDIINKF